MKAGIVDVGGGLRGVYAAGVFDRCMDQHIHFDLGVGVSAGSANVASYIAGQRKRNYIFYIEYPFRREYMSVHNLFAKHAYLDLDYIYGTLSNTDGEYPLDYRRFIESGTQFLAVATNAETGEATYFDKRDVHMNQYDVLKASCAIPVVCPPYPVGDAWYYDGALSDPVPIEKAFACGCDKVVLVLTKPKELLRVPGNDAKLARMIAHRYPRSAECLRRRAQRYNEGVAKAKAYAAMGRVLIVAPDDTCGVRTLTRDRDALRQLYHKGYEDGGRIRDFLRES